MSELTRRYYGVRLPGKDRPRKPPGRLVHAQELDRSGTPYHPRTTVCGKQPRDEESEFIYSEGKVNCPACKSRMK